MWQRRSGYTGAFFLWQKDMADDIIDDVIIFEYQYALKRKV